MIVRRRPSRWTVLTLVASAALQVAALTVIGSRVSGGDAYTYIALARDWDSLGRLLSPDAFFGDLGPLSEVGNFWPAGYPGYLSLFDGFGEQWLILVRMSQIAMVLGIAVMVAALAREVSDAAARWTLLVAAFSPTLIWAGWTIGYELLLGFLLVLAAYLLSRPGTTSVTWQSPAVVGVTAGVIAGVALIVQFRAAFAIPFLGYLAWQRHGVRALLVFTGATTGVLGVWGARTWVAIGVPVPWSANGPYNLWNGNGPHATGTNVFPLPTPPGGMSLAQASIDWILANPGAFFDLVAHKALMSFYPTEVADVSDMFPAEGLMTVAQWGYSLAFLTLLLLFFGAQAWRLSLAVQRLWPLAMIGIALVLPNLIFIAVARYRIPAEPFFIPVVVGTGIELLRRARRPPSTVDHPQLPVMRS